MATDKNRKSISITQQTKDALDEIKHSGQSYEGLIQELIKLRKKEHGKETGEIKGR